MLTIELGGIDRSDLQYLIEKYPSLKFVVWPGRLVRVTGTEEDLQHFLAESYTNDGSEIDYIFEFQTV